MRVLALIPGEIGDQIALFPTFDKLKELYPHAQIEVVVEPASIPAYRVSKSVTRTIKFDYQGNNSLADWTNFLGIIRDREYEIVLTLDSRWISGFFLWLAGIPRRIGFAGTPVHPFLTDSVPSPSEGYRPHQYYTLLSSLGIIPPCPELSISIPAKDVEWAKNEQQRLGINGTGYVLLYDYSHSPTVDHPVSTYPIENWQAIVEDFQKRQPALPIVLLNDDHNRGWIQSLVQANPNGLKVNNPGDTGKIAALVAGASLLLSVDSLPLQFGVATQIFTLALLGKTNPAVILPPSNRLIALQSPHADLKELSPDTVLAKVWGG
ncbi:MAG: lipopolysaccharide heptosyltransferase family protein [Cyanobacteria bacterium WB6_1B_304]|jgi:ADP-heptose:LPS heptosyltransferase|nr:lipopolysaccharide heptosyltransferase family protein [Cyanobacteria bacterium WB6_1B_304]